MKKICIVATDGKHHTIHLHGHDFVILKTEYPEYINGTGMWEKPNADLECPDKRMCRKMRWRNPQSFSLEAEQYPISVSSLTFDETFIIFQ